MNCSGSLSIHNLFSLLSHWKTPKQIRRCCITPTSVLLLNKTINHHPEKNLNNNVWAVRLTNSSGVLLFETTKAGVCMKYAAYCFDDSVGSSLAARQEEQSGVSQR